MRVWHNISALLDVVEYLDGLAYGVVDYKPDRKPSVVSNDDVVRRCSSVCGLV